MHRLSLERIERAGVIDPAFLHTPQFVCEPLSNELGVRLVLKIETLNPIRSFKGRGAALLVSQVAPGTPLVCASAGNFGQAMASACRKRGVPLTVYAGTAANPLKLERMQAMGARVTDVLRCEVETLGYPKAALFSFSIAVVAYNTHAVVKAALRAAHGAEKVDEGVSDYHLMHDVVSTHVGMGIAVDESVWSSYESMSAGRLARELLRLAGGVQLSRYPKKKRGPKKPQPRKTSGTGGPHIATARVLTQSKRR